MKILRINILDFILNYNCCTGQNYGEHVRELIKLDELDKTDETVEIVFPDNLYTVGRSWFREFFRKSFKVFDTEEKFNNKYKIVAKDCHLVLIKRYIKDFYYAKRFSQRNPNDDFYKEAQHELAALKDKENNAIDKGSWQVDYWPNKYAVVLQSHDFEHDVALIIDGDFGGDLIVKKEYASRLADWMNQQLGKKTPITEHYIPLKNAKDKSNGLEELSKAILDECCSHNTVVGVVKESQTEQPDIAVWYGSMPESNGKENWTAILYKKSDGIFNGCNITIDRSEYPDRVRYEADRARYLIGELTQEPLILDYDSDKKSPYEQKRLGEQNA